MDRHPGALGLNTPGPDVKASQLVELVAAHRACRRCVAAGHLERAHPVFSGRSAKQRILLVGQAPGPIETDTGRPFAGRAGRQLMRWLTRTGFADEAGVRAQVWITSVTTCFPGRRPDGSGDRRPSPAEVALCAPWLDSVLALLAPRLVVPVGSLALQRIVGPGRRLDDTVGAVLDGSGRLLQPGAAAPERVVVALPHPSGQSRWLNDPGRVALLEDALQRLARLVPWALTAAPGITLPDW
ncbi:MAG TPA: uracil-DNA glycosylase [Candidatus Dormibacteraeota bacterium]